MTIMAFAKNYLLRIMAAICLTLALLDATRLLGVNLGDLSPLSFFGVTGFVLLAVFTIFRLFAAVGMWIDAGWGAPLLIGVTVIEIVLLIFGNPDVSVTFLGLAIRMILLFGVAAYFYLRFRENLHD